MTSSTATTPASAHAPRPGPPSGPTRVRRALLEHPRTSLVLAGFAMFLVGSQAGVATAITAYPLWGGQAMRYAAAAIVLLLLARLRGRRWIGLTPRELGFVVALAFVGLVMFNAVQIGAVRHGSPAVVGTVLATLPVVLAVVAPLLAGRRPRGRLVAAAGVVALGAAVTAGLGTTGPLGALLAVLTLACEVGFSLLAVPLVRRLGALRTSAYAAVAAVPQLLVLGAVLDGPGMFRTPTIAELAAFAYVTLIVTVVAFCCWYAALGRIGAERAGLFAGLVPVGAMATGQLIGAGPPGLVDLLGAALVVAGVVFGSRAPTGPGAPAEQATTPPTVEPPRRT